MIPPLYAVPVIHLPVVIPQATPPADGARPMTKLSRTMMRSWVARHLATKQDNLCPLCGKFIDLKIKGEGVIDHDHDTGEIRGVLHRSCNAAEGKISNAAGQWGAKSTSYPAILAFLRSLVDYLSRPTGAGVIYPMHKTADEMIDAGKLRAKKLRAERKAKQAVAIAARKAV